jgi:hypothetical protein
VGRFCLNCGHPIGEPAPAAPVTTAPPPPVSTVEADEQAAPDASPAPAEPEPAPEPVVVPVQAADPTAVAPPPPRHEWDPSEELLPYEEAYELEPDSALPSKAWIYWVLGAVLLVGVVFVLLRVFQTDDVDTAAGTTGETSSPAPSGKGSEAPEESAPASPEGPKAVGKRSNVAAGATFAVPATAPPTTDFDGNLVAYEASQMGDGLPSTAWRMAGDATGQTVTVTLARPTVISRVGLVNGYAKQVAGVDWYPNNRRILAVTWGFEDGSSIQQTFAERPGMQQLKVPPVESGTVTITITSVTPPGSGNLGRDYTAISEVSITGQRAG